LRRLEVEAGAVKAGAVETGGGSGDWGVQWRLVAVETGGGDEPAANRTELAIVDARRRLSYLSL